MCNLVLSLKLRFFFSEPWMQSPKNLGPWVHVSQVFHSHENNNSVNSTDLHANHFYLQNFSFSFNTVGPLYCSGAHVVIKYRVCACHPIWRSSKIISLYFINIRKQRFLILHMHSLCLFPPSDRSSLPNVRGQEYECHECIIYERNTQYNMIHMNGSRNLA